MHREFTGLLGGVLKSRGALLRLLTTAIVLALGVNLIATYVATLSGMPQWGAGLIGLVLVIAAFARLVRDSFQTKEVSRTLRADFIHKVDENLLITIPRYRFSERLSQIVSGLFAENGAAKKVWDRDKIRCIYAIDSKSGQGRKHVPAANAIIVEALEYIVLEELTTQLADYFRKPGFAEERLRKLGRNDIPAILLSNRFLETFSRPMVERQAFVDDALDGSKAVSSWKSSGELYQYFELVLPEKATVSRPSDSCLEISTPKFRLRIESSFEGFGSTLPMDFMLLYLGISELPWGNLATYQGQIKVSVRFRVFALLSRQGWEYHLWLDSFIEKLEQMLSVSGFLERIGWEESYTAVQLLRPDLLAEGREKQAQAFLKTLPAEFSAALDPEGKEST